MNIWKYVGWFSLGCVVTAVVWAVLSLLWTHVGWLGGGLAWVMVGAPVAVNSFVSDNRRIPVASERRWLIAACSGAYVGGLAVVVLVAMALSQTWTRAAIEDVGGLWFYLVLAVLVPLAVIWVTFRYLPPIRHTRLVDREIRKAGRSG